MHRLHIRWGRAASPSQTFVSQFGAQKHPAPILTEQTARCTEQRKRQIHLKAPKTYQNINTYQTPPASTPEYTNRKTETVGELPSPATTRNTVSSNQEQHNKILIILHPFLGSDKSLRACPKGIEW